MFCYTGHPFYDIGLATVTAFVEKSDPSQVTQDDLDTVASFIEREYVQEPLKSFLAVAFTTNAWFNQPAFANQPEKRRDYANRILRNRTQSESLGGGELCVFTGQPVSTVAFSDSLLPGRAFRQHIPLLTGEGVINFHPYGDAGLPVSGEAALFIQAFPLGCAKCGGKLLAVHSDNPEITQEFAATFLKENLMRLSLAHQSKSRKMPESKASAKTLLIETLLSLEQRRQEEAEERRPFSVTAYHFTNSGQSNPLDDRNPPLEIYHLPLELTEFLFYLKSPIYRLEWEAIAKRAWRLAPKKVKKSKTENKEDKRPQKNFLYEDLFQLPENAARFIRQYFLRIPIREKPEDDPRRNYSLRDEASLVSWKITELFLMKVISVDKDRIKQIRDLADQLAEYISKENDSKFFNTFFREQNYDYFRNNLIKVNLSNVKRGNPPLIRFEPFIEVFEEGSEIARPDWKLSRDLILIRMVEQLYNLGWLGKNVDALHVENDENKEEI